MTTIRFRCARPGAATFVDLLAPAVDTVVLNGRELDPAVVFDGTRILLADLAESNELIVDAACAYSRTGEGMHRFADPEDGEVYLYTQYEPADARRVFANFEQPDLKAPFSFTVTAPAHWTVLGNGELEGAVEPVGADAATWRFARTLPISTYITSIVAGPYHVERDRYTRATADGGTLEIPLGALCRTSLARHFDADDIFTITKQGLDFFHDHFDFPYPFGKYDQAFVPEYNLGAMENPGLVTFREEFVFRGKVTQVAYEGRANVILHEMSHMWFGDLVTMEWWDDLWLKESFADFMGTFSQVESTRFTDGWITFANRRKAWAYRADQLPSTHPVTADMRDLQDAKLNFDGITYAKGASVLKQLVAYVGRDAFLEGARRYFKRHAYGNTRLADLLSVLAETSGRDMAEWSRSWLQTAGVNSLTPEVTYDDTLGRVAELAVLQGAAASHPELRPHRVAIGLYRRGAEGALERYARAEIDVAGPRTVVAELAGAERPDLILVNDEDLTYCKVRFDEGSLATLRAGLGDIADPMARALAWSAVWNLTRDGLMPARDYLRLVRGLRRARVGDRRAADAARLGADRAAPLRGARVARAGRVGAGRVRAAGAATARSRAAATSWRGRGSSPRWRSPRRIWTCCANCWTAPRRSTGLDVDQELRWTFLVPLAAHGAADEAALAAELARDDTASGRRHQVRALAARPSAVVKAAAWHDVVESDALSNALVEATIAGFDQPGQRELLAPYADKYFEAIERVWEQRSIEIGMSVVRGLFPALQAGEATLRAADGWLEGHQDAAPALRRLVAEARDDLARALRAQECDAAETEV